MGRWDVTELALIVMFLVCLPAFGTTYYLRADGIAPDKTLATGCTSPATAMSVSTHNGELFSPGDTIVLCPDGGVFRATLYPPSSGVAGSPIVYEGGGTTVISAADLIRGWSPDTGNVYRASVETAPQQVFMDGLFGVRKASRAELRGDLDWYWETGTLFVYSSDGSPDDRFTEPGVEAGSRDVCFNLARDYLVVDGITARHGNYGGFTGWNPGSHITLRNSTAEWNWQNGIEMNGTVTYTDITIEDSVARFNGAVGILLGGPGRNSAIRGNWCYLNGTWQSQTVDFDYFHQWTAGIKLWDDTGLMEGIEVSENEIYANGRGLPGDYQGRGCGVWIDGVRGNAANPCAVVHNLIHDNRGNGIFVEISSNTVVFGNVVVGNASNDGAGGEEWLPANIVLDVRAAFSTDNNRVFNNTCVGGKIGIKLTSYEQTSSSISDNQIENNIVVGASHGNLHCNLGGDNDGVHGAGNTYENNAFGPAGPGFVSWGGVAYDSYDTWRQAATGVADSIEGDPQLAGTDLYALHLRSSSPCVDAGRRLDPTFAMGLRSSSTWPDSVSTTNQDLHGGSWEVGAYVYEEAATPTPTPTPVLPRSMLVPVVAHLEGGDGTSWRSDVSLTNREGVPIRVRASYQPAAGRVYVRELELSAFETLLFTDFVDSVFHIPSSRGPVRFETLDPGVLLPAAVSRTFAKRPSGSFGQAVPVVTDPTAGIVYLPGLRQSDEYRSNVAVAAAPGSAVTALFDLFRGGGGAPVATVQRSLPAGVEVQWSLTGLFPGLAYPAVPMALRVRLSAPAVAFASVVDNTTSDAVTCRGVPSARDWLLPVVTYAAGRDGTFWSSDVEIVNPGPNTAVVSMEYLPENTDNAAGGVERRGLLLGPESASHFGNVVVATMGAGAGKGVLVIRSSQLIAVTSRAFTAGPQGGTTGHGVDAVPPGRLASGQRVLPGVRMTGGFRTNVGVLTGDAEASVRFTLRDHDGSVVGETDETVPARSVRQWNVATLFGGRLVRTPSPAGALVVDSPVDFLPYLVLVDGSSQDPVLFLPGD